MAGDEGIGKSSEAESQPLRSSVAGSPRPVFISYASHDTAVAQKVCAALEAEGLPCWIAPRDVVPGTLYADGIVHAIDESSILVLILSQQAIASAHVGREIEAQGRIACFAGHEVLVPVADQNLHCTITKIIAAAWTSECQIVGICKSVESTPNQSAIRGECNVCFQAGKALPLMKAVGRLSPVTVQFPVSTLNCLPPTSAFRNPNLQPI